LRTLLLTRACTPLLALAACGAGEETTSASQPAAEANAAGLPQGGDPANLDPADFVEGIDNPYWPMAPGTRWVYRESDSEGTEQRVEVTVTEKTKEILGIEATVVHDIVTEDGKLVEDTFDWYAQDSDGNVWYLGEDTKEYENGKFVGTAGAWEAGVDGAEAGVIMPAHPEVGMAYRQEYYKGEAEDAGEILSLDEKAEVPYGSFSGVLMTRTSRRSSPTSWSTSSTPGASGPS